MLFDKSLRLRSQLCTCLFKSKKVTYFTNILFFLYLPEFFSKANCFVSKIGKSIKIYRHKVLILKENATLCFFDEPDLLKEKYVTKQKWKARTCDFQCAQILRLK